MTVVEDTLTEEQLIRLAEMREAQEPETGDIEEPEGTEPAPEPEPQEPPSSILEEKEREKRLKSEDTRHENALKKVWGEAWEEHAFCPLCIGQGFLVPIPAGEQPDEIWQAITALSGRIETQELNYPPELVVCGRCNGWGVVGDPLEGENTISRCPAASVTRAATSTSTTRSTRPSSGS